MWAALAAAVLLMAGQRTPPEATAHARDELANCIAQGKCPTETPTASPTPTLVPAAAPLPSSTPRSESLTATPSPPLPIPAEGDAWLSGYLRPSTWQDGVTLELALPMGRWNVRFEDPSCAGPWTNVALAPGAQLAVSSPAGGLDWLGMCSLVGASWSSAAPCAMDDAGRCDVLQDASYWDWLGRQPTPVPTDTPAPAHAPPVAAPTPAPVAAPAPRVFAPPAPAATPLPTPTHEVEPAETPPPPVATLEAPLGSDELTRPTLLRPTPTPPLAWWLANATATAQAQLTPTPDEATPSATENAGGMAAFGDGPAEADSPSAGDVLGGFVGACVGWLFGAAGMASSVLRQVLPVMVLGVSAGLPVAAPVLATLGTLQHARSAPPA